MKLWLVGSHFENYHYNSTSRAYSLSAVFKYSIIFTGGFASLPYQGQ